MYAPSPIPIWSPFAHYREQLEVHRAYNYTLHPPVAAAFIRLRRSWFNRLPIRVVAATAGERGRCGLKIVVTKAEIIARVGADAYREACELATQVARRPNYGRDRGQGGLGPDLPHDITDLICGTDSTWREKLSLFFEIYDDMPSYGHLMYAKNHYHDFSGTERQIWWQMVRERLASEDPALTQPLAYSLWCDFFEDPDTVAEAWAEVSDETVPERVLRIALGSSGPVPYPLKRRVYNRLLSDPHWHGSILDSLFWSAFDVYGKIEPRDACELLTKLVVGPDTEALQRLREKLDCSTRGAA